MLSLEDKTKLIEEAKEQIYELVVWNESHRKSQPEQVRLNTETIIKGISDLSLIR